MNQDQVKELLLKLDSDVAEFKVIFSGKSSKKVDGLYHPDSCEIIIHNKNFNNDNTLMYTAIHEFAHHIQFTKHQVSSTRAHTNLYWDIFHRLLNKAEETQIYVNLFEEDDHFKKLTKKIKENYLNKNGELMKEFGKLLIQALELCQRKQVIFEDYVDRVLGLNRSSAKSLMKIYAMHVDSSIGYDNMKIVAGIKEPEQRNEAIEGFHSGKTQHMIKQEIKNSKPEPSLTANKLLAQKRRIEKSIAALEERLDDLNMQIEKMEIEGPES